MVDQDFEPEHRSIIVHRSSSIDHRPSIIVHRPSIIVHRSSIIDHRPSIIDHRSSIIVHRSSSIDHRPSPITSRPTGVVSLEESGWAAFGRFAKVRPACRLEPHRSSRSATVVSGLNYLADPRMGNRS
jgi:hypothetical protein